MKSILFSGWTVMRALRLLVGGWFIYYGITDYGWVYALAGSYFFVQGLLNLGCAACRQGSCQVKAE